MRDTVALAGPKPEAEATAGKESAAHAGADDKPLSMMAQPALAAGSGGDVAQATEEEERAAKSWGFARYVELSKELECLRVKWLRRHAVDFTRGLPGGKTVRQALHRVGGDVGAMVRTVQDHLSLPLSEVQA